MQSGKPHSALTPFLQASIHFETGETMATEVPAPLAGKILEGLVKAGAKVEEDDELLVIEALKMENTVCAPCGGTVREIRVKKDDSVQDGKVLLVIE